MDGLAPRFLMTSPSGGNGETILVLAHGAGAPMDSDFMHAVADGMAACGVGVARFEFGYMAQRRNGGGRRPPPKAPALADEYRATVSSLKARLPGKALLIGGKSMGGRIASMIADDLFKRGEVGGCVCLGYPFHPVGKPEKPRVAHLEATRCPILIVQGDRDALGGRDFVSHLTLSPTVKIAWLPDGDHDFRARVASGHTLQANIARAARFAADFALRCARQ